MRASCLRNKGDILLKRIVIWALAILAVLLLVAVLLLKFYAYPRLAEWGATAATQALSKPVSVESVSCNWDALLGAEQTFSCEATNVTIELPDMVLIQHMQIEATRAQLAKKTVQKVVVDGVQGTLIAKPSDAEAPVVLPLPMQAEELKALPLNVLEVRNVNLHYVDGKATNIAAEGSAYFEQETSQLQLQLDHVEGKVASNEFVIENAAAAVNLVEDGRWQGKVNVGRVTSPLIPEKAASINLNANIELTAECLNWSEAKLNDALKDLEQVAKGYYCFAGDKKGLDTNLNGSYALKKDARIRWQGKLAKDVLALGLSLKAFPLEQMLTEMTQGSVNATGSVSGSFPVQYNLKKQRWLWKSGTLKADAPGVLHLGEGVLPSSVENLKMVSDLLSNLTYKDLELSIGPDPENPQKPLIEMKVEGNNPLVMDGKPVKLKVRLSGDILETIQSSILPLTNPEGMVKGNE